MFLEETASVWIDNWHIERPMADKCKWIVLVY